MRVHAHPDLAKHTALLNAEDAHALEGTRRILVRTEKGETLLHAKIGRAESGILLTDPVSARLGSDALVLPAREARCLPALVRRVNGETLARADIRALIEDLNEDLLRPEETAMLLTSLVMRPKKREQEVLIEELSRSARPAKRAVLVEDMRALSLIIVPILTAAGCPAATLIRDESILHPILSRCDATARASSVRETMRACGAIMRYSHGAISAIEHWARRLGLEEEYRELCMNAYARDLGARTILAAQPMRGFCGTRIITGKGVIRRAYGAAGEARIACEALDGTMSDELEYACALAGTVLEKVGIVREGHGYDAARHQIRTGKARQKFDALCEAQGRRSVPSAPYRFEISSRSTRVDVQRAQALDMLLGADERRGAGITITYPSKSSAILTGAACDIRSLHMGHAFAQDYQVLRMEKGFRR